VDVDGDGDLDLVIGRDEPLVTLLLNDGTGQFAEGATLDVVDPPDRLAACDLDGNGAMELLVGNGSRFSVFANDGSGASPRGPTMRRRRRSRSPAAT